MKGFMQWFKSSNKMKRWMFLILLGIILMCYGLAEILVLKELVVIDIVKIAVSFTIGVVAIVLGLVFLNKRTLEVLIEATDDRINEEKTTNMKSLIFNKKVYHQGPNIVVIGGGTGLNTVLRGLKKYTDNLTAIVTVSDYGEPLTESQKKLETKPLDDVKNSIIALSNEEEELEKILNLSFDNGKLEKLSFADIYFSAMKSANGDVVEAISKSNKIFNITGNVLPVTLDEMNITAELANGYIVTEREKLPEIVYEKVTKINRIYLNPSNCKAAPGVIEAIKEADCIIIGPGSLYTNVIPNLLVVGVAKAIKESPAFKVYISNIMTEPGQTDEYTVSDHINAIIEHCGKGIVDYCIYDTGEIVPEFIKRYNLEGQDLVESYVENIKGITFLQRNLSTISNDFIRHDPELVAQSIIELICDDLKYQDKQNDPQYLMLSNKLKEDKRINKMKKHAKKDSKKNNKKVSNNDKSKKRRKQSKFTNKYSQRIESIKKADEKVRLKEKIKAVKKSKKKTPQEIREEMLKKLEKSNFKK